MEGVHTNRGLKYPDPPTWRFVRELSEWADSNSDMMEYKFVAIGQ